MAILTRFRDSGRNNISVPRASGLISMTLSQPKKGSRSLTKNARVPQLSTSGEEKDMSEITDAAAFMDLSEKAKQALEVLIEAINSVCYMYDSNF